MQAYTLLDEVAESVLNVLYVSAVSVRDGGALVRLLTPPGKPWHFSTLWHQCLLPSLNSHRLGALAFHIEALCRLSRSPIECIIAGMDLTGPRCLVSAHLQVDLVDIMGCSQCSRMSHLFRWLPKSSDCHKRGISGQV